MRKAFVGVTAVVLLGAVGSACVALHRINANLKNVRQEVAEAGSVPFRLMALDGEEAHRRATAGFEPLAAPNNFTTGAAFEGKLYLAGPAGISVYDAAGGDRAGGTPRLLRAGIDLPAAPVVAFASGRLRGEASASLIAATRGGGLLLFAAGNVRQLLPLSASARDVTAVLLLASGDVLIGTRRAGLLVFDGKTLRVFQPGLADVPVTALAGTESDFWVGTRTRGVLHWHAGELDAFDAAGGLPDAQVEDIAVSDAGVFVGTPLGVAQFVDGRPVRTLAKGTFAHALALAGDTLLIATIDQGVRKVSLKTSPPRSAGRASSGERGIAESEALPVTHFLLADNALLAVESGSVLRLTQTGAWEKVLEVPAEALADGNVSSLSFSPDGRLWIGYFDRGVDVLDLQTNRAQHVEDDHVFCVNRIVPDAQRHTMNVATANGLVLFDGSGAAARVKQVLSRRDGLISDQVTDVGFTSGGMVAATPAGLTFFTANGAQSLYAFQGLVNNHVYALATDAGNGRVLAGTLGGISMLEDGAVRQNVTLKNSGLKRNWITAIARVPQEGAEATWFVGTYGGGVVQMDAAGRVSAIDGAPATAVVNPNAMLVTAQHVFAGSLSDGLLMYSRASRRWTQVTTGLPSRNVTALAESRGELYIGTDNGIVRIAEARLP